MLWRISTRRTSIPTLYNEDKGAYGPPDWFDDMYAPCRCRATGYPAQHGAPPLTLELSTDQVPADDSYSVILSIGVQFGLLLDGNRIELLKHMGGAKILGVK